MHCFLNEPVVKNGEYMKRERSLFLGSWCLKQLSSDAHNTNIDTTCQTLRLLQHFTFLHHMVISLFLTYFDLTIIFFTPHLILWRFYLNTSFINKEYYPIHRFNDTMCMDVQNVEVALWFSGKASLSANRNGRTNVTFALERPPTRRHTCSAKVLPCRTKIQ